MKNKLNEYEQWLKMVDPLFGRMYYWERSKLSHVDKEYKWGSMEALMNGLTDMYPLSKGNKNDDYKAIERIYKDYKRRPQRILNYRDHKEKDETKSIAIVVCSCDKIK